MVGRFVAPSVHTNGGDDGAALNGNLPPPSTIAAQLVRNHAESARGTRLADTTATFRQLLQEILNKTSAPETDPEVNYKLIKVVVEAGIDVLFNDNPFAQWDILLPQTIDSLAVISATIRQQPGILFLSDSQPPKSYQRPHLLLWLLPKVISLSCHAKGDQLQNPLKSLLCCMITSLSKTLDLWQRAYALIETFRDCVDDLLSFLQKLISLNGHIRPPLNITLPPARSLARLWSEVQLEVALPSGCQLQVKDANSAGRIILFLLLVLKTVRNNDEALLNLRQATRPLQGWSLDAECSLTRLVLHHRSWFVRNDMMSLFSVHLLRLVKVSPSIHEGSDEGFTCTLQCCADFLFAGVNDPFPMDIQTELASTMSSLLEYAHGSRPISMAKELLSPAFKPLCSEEKRYQTCHGDLRRVVNTWLTKVQSQALNLPWVIAAMRRQEEDQIMPDADQQAGLVLNSTLRGHGGSQRYSNLRKLRPCQIDEQPPQVNLYAETLRKTVEILGKRSSSIAGLHHEAIASYASLSELEKHHIWSLLSACACAASKTLQRTKCTHCHSRQLVSSSNLSGYWDDDSTKEERNELLLTIEQLLQSSELQKSDEHRVLATLAIRSFVIHTREAARIDLSASTIGQWCLKSLHSSVRDLRIAAGRTLVAFLRDDLSSDAQKHNHKIALDCLRTLSARESTGQHETLILAWGQVAVACGEEELNLALLHLTRYLGHPNTLICALAFSELENIAETLSIAPQSLIRPYHRSIAVEVVQDLITKPQKTQQLVDFLRMSVPQFLLLTQRETIPFLVLTKKRDILQRIALARAPDTSVEDICLQPSANLAAILALLLVQPTHDVEASAIEILTEVAPAFAKSDLTGLLKLDPVQISCEMLKAAGDEAGGNDSKACQAIKTFAVLHERRPGQPRANAKVGRMLGSFFEAHVLGIMAQFSNSIDSTVLYRAEKIRCIKGVEQMITLAKGNITIALPQIRACLQSAIDQQGLQDAAFSAWLALINALEGEEVVELVDHTFALVVQHWSKFSSKLQQRTYDSIGLMLRTHSNLIREKVDTIPSLATIPLMSKFDSEIRRLKDQEQPGAQLRAFAKRLGNENVSIVARALQELTLWLEDHQAFIHDVTVSDIEQEKVAVATILRALLNVCTRDTSQDPSIADLCSQCIGIIGCLDPNKIESNIVKRQSLVLHNFENAAEIVEWVAVMFEDILVPAFKSATNARSQGFLGYVMQELVRFCGFNEVAAVRLRASQASPAYTRWMEMPESVRNTLFPFLTSRYSLSSNVDVKPGSRTYPVFKVSMSHSSWLKTWTYDMLWRGKTVNARLLFPTLARIIKSHDLSVARFLAPYAALNIVIGGTNQEAKDIATELLTVLSTKSKIESEKEILRQNSTTVFATLDYMSKWLQEKKRTTAAHRTMMVRAGQSPNEFEEAQALGQIASVEDVIGSIPAHVIAQRAIDCGSYARALFHWELFIREQSQQSKEQEQSEHDRMYERLHNIYMQIDEPDGLDGLTAHFNLIDGEQQAFQHRRAGRWSAAQSWYEIELAKTPSNTNLQISLLNCFRESGQFDQVTRYASHYNNAAQSLSIEPAPRLKLRSLLAEACWSTGRLEDLRDILDGSEEEDSSDFNIGVAKILLAMQQKDLTLATTTINNLRGVVAKNLNSAAVSSLQTCHDTLLRLHIVYEMGVLGGVSQVEATDNILPVLHSTLEKRLAVIGSYIADKQYLLGIRRAVMQVSDLNIPISDIGSSWITTASLARKANVSSTAYHAVLNALRCGDDTASIEHARLLWRDGQQRQAIQRLEGIINSQVLDKYAQSISNTEKRQNLPLARAHLLQSKWLDASGQTQATQVTAKYRLVTQYFSRWEKGFYYLGKHYNKLLEAEKALPSAKQSEAFHTNEFQRLVAENYLRSIPFGTKYWHQTIPKIITLWLDLGTDCLSKNKADADFVERRSRYLEAFHTMMVRYLESRIKPYIFYNALPQMISRISHPNPRVFEMMSLILSRIVISHPSQALWSLFAVIKSTKPDRARRGELILSKVIDSKSRAKSGTVSLDLRMMITQGQKLSDALLQACEEHIEARSTNVSLSRDLHFNHKLAPSNLVIPLESTLTVSMPAESTTKAIRDFKAFTHDKVTISSFSDDVLVLSSLQRPRKLTVRGSDGKSYGLLCKPKDDLRKDQRLMEFNTMINRALKRDAETSKRQLNIKTYGVTPLSEESGTIEWVEGIKPLRDILLKLYSRKGIQPNYTDLRTLLTEAGKAPENVEIFSNKILAMFPSVLHEWFAEIFPEPDSWFAARLNYARSAAVMSMVGHVLGLGDRHGENILLREDTGGVFHVDFNCLFDKGLTFEKPELVPFRLTHNMVDAMGSYGYEGPFRKSAELTLGLLRQHQDTLMNILETFVHDPTTDFIGKKKRSTPGVPDTPQEVLDAVRDKLRGLMRGEKIPLSVEGHVDALIRQAIDPGNLCQMYIGWCAFL